MYGVYKWTKADRMYYSIRGEIEKGLETRREELLNKKEKCARAGLEAGAQVPDD